jgi:hypothetical protein
MQDYWCGYKATIKMRLIKFEVGIFNMNGGDFLGLCFGSKGFDSKDNYYSMGDDKGFRIYRTLLLSPFDEHKFTANNQVGKLSNMSEFTDFDDETF